MGTSTCYAQNLLRSGSPQLLLRRGPVPNKRWAHWSNQPLTPSVRTVWNVAVGKIEAVEALCFHKLQLASTTEPQLIQQESLGNNRILRVSISIGIWFGTRGSEVQILSPRPFQIKDLRAELGRDSSVRETGFTKKVYILAAIDPGISR